MEIIKVKTLPHDISKDKIHISSSFTELTLIKWEHSHPRTHKWKPVQIIDKFAIIDENKVDIVVKLATILIQIEKLYWG